MTATASGMRRTPVVTSIEPVSTTWATSSASSTRSNGKLNVDPKRIALIGHSNGGFMTYAVACAHADRIAALVSLAGATFAKAADCAPSEPVAVVQLHGTADDIVEFDGGSVEEIGSSPMGPYPGAEATVAAWAKYDGCEPSAATLDERIDVDADVTVERCGGGDDRRSLVGMRVRWCRRALDHPGRRARPEPHRRVLVRCLRLLRRSPQALTLGLPSPTAATSRSTRATSGRPSASSRTGGGPTGSGRSARGGRHGPSRSAPGRTGRRAS